MTPNVDDLLEDAEGRELAQAGTRQAVVCDFCESVVHPNARITHYATDWRFPYGRAPGVVRLDRLYCDECDRHRIRMPCADSEEVLFSQRMTKERTLVDWDIRDYSPAGAGVSWTPGEMVDALFPESVVTIQDIAPYASPESVVDFLVYHGVDPRDVVSDDGSIQWANLSVVKDQMMHGLSPAGERQ